jgi:hypothetical protein
VTYFSWLPLAVFSDKFRYCTARTDGRGMLGPVK